VKPSRDLLLANGAALVLLLIVLLIGWRLEAAFGLAVLAILNLLVLLRGRPGGPRDEGDGG
jgi:hypothetical protein